MTASSSPEHNNVVVNKKHQADTLSQVKLHKKVRHSEAQGGRGEGGDSRETMTKRKTDRIIMKPIFSTSKHAQDLSSLSFLAYCASSEFGS